MTQEVTLRIACDDDLSALADLRWRLKTDDQPATDAEARSRFAEEFCRSQRADRRSSDIVHWLACVGETPVAVMSVIEVRKLASPGKAPGRWGYLTNCYVRPEHRNTGVGGRLLKAVQDWARDEVFELLIVWPSDRAFPFYERGGFSRPADPLVWTPR